ncbi:granulin b isoform X2 [Salminus brasiliensis]|uniref:granulin b isoform X2 n=1 Tax=Salminus brasiliensis TaxID=930266 RepID=UPI003B82D770
MHKGVWVLVCVLSGCSALICPDGGMCDDGNTCCQTPSGGYGCCPLPNAECCSDHLHCCYEGTLCDLEHSKCVNKTHVLDWVKRVPIKQPSLPQAVVCPDQESECPDDTTCCQLPDGSWGCCPMPNAVCCEDKMHCCPQGTTCDLAHSKCVTSALDSIPLSRKSPAHRRAQWEKTPVVCPDKVSSCPDDTTCCPLGNGSYGCCPMPKAVCCEDYIHCCPYGTVCNLAKGTCDDSAKPLTLVQWLEKVPAFKRVPQPANEKCDSSKSCPKGATCCKMESGAWGCCPLPQAVCCTDHLHCCPRNTVCNVAAGTCDSTISEAGKRLSVPWVSKTAATALPPQNDQCDETSACPTGTTCCRQKSGAWACCPLPQAVCCDDHEHCCPQGYKCDVAHESCDHPFLPRMLWLSKQPALMSMTQLSNAGVIAESAVADAEHKCDAQTSCPRDNTCCFMQKFNKWGCCPLPQAVCCGNGDHCCPNGYTCDTTKPICIKGHLEIPWFKKQEAKVTQGSEFAQEVTGVKCDSTTSCPTGSTCCRLTTGQWGCCPHVKAVCCEDHEHCCPEGYTCDLQAGTCLRPSTSHTVALALVHTHTDKEVMCDATSHCSETQTCCKVSDTEWACCPFKQAVCCKDMKHCCPLGYVCDSKAKGCTRASSLTWWSSSL